MQPDGTRRSYPPVSLADLADLDVRVNVTTGRGQKRAFFIHRWRDAGPDTGPVIDLFGGMIQLQADDVSVTTESRRIGEMPEVEGRVPLEFREDEPLVTAEFADGRQGRLIMDIGAGATALG